MDPGQCARSSRRWSYIRLRACIRPLEGKRGGFRAMMEIRASSAHQDIGLTGLAPCRFERRRSDRSAISSTDNPPAKPRVGQSSAVLRVAQPRPPHALIFTENRGRASTANPPQPNANALGTLARCAHRYLRDRAQILKLGRRVALQNGVQFKEGTLRIRMRN